MGRSGARTARAQPEPTPAPGAVVIGGDYQGLGIVRSLGRRGVDVLVVDDERSIARHSRFATAAVRVGELRDEQETVRTLLELGERHALEGWVVFPTREETVAALSRYRERLTPRFRIPTPAWDVVEWAWDKRKTYEIAAELGIATPRTWLVGSAEELGAVDSNRRSRSSRRSRSASSTRPARRRGARTRARSSSSAFARRRRWSARAR
jgi:D-aspartate ligase